MDKFECNYYIFIANDVIYDLNKRVTATEIARTLLFSGFWAFTSTAPLRGKLQPGDKVLIYLAGPGRRYFIAQATIATTPMIVDESVKKILQNLGLGFMSHSVQLTDIAMFGQVVHIVPLLPKLGFIKNKKNYGLHLRLSIVRISGEDYNLIVRHGNCSDALS